MEFDTKKDVSNLKVSVFIPTLNAGDKWVELLKMISIQDLKINNKIIIDSGSKDNTIENALAYDFKVIQIPIFEFNHGKTRQQLIEADKNCEIGIFLTQDAIPSGPDSFYHLVKPFEDPKVGMTYGRQLPHFNAKVLEIHARLFNYPDHDEVVSIEDLEAKGFKIFFCSNSFSAYRKSALMSVGGFPLNSIMGEDAIVAAKMLSAGYKKAYSSKAKVYHSHSYSLKEEFKRYFDTRVFHEQNKWMIEKYGKPTGEGIKYIKSELAYTIKNDWKYLFNSITSSGAKWLGYNIGRFYKKIPKPILKKISMHGFHWK